MALALSIKIGDSFAVGDVVVTLAAQQGKKIKVLCEGPRGTQVHRKAMRPQPDYPSATAATSAQLIAQYPAHADQARRIATEQRALEITEPLRKAAPHITEGTTT